MTDGRKYGSDHRALRRALLPGAWGTPCPRCGVVMRHGEALDLGHRDDGPGWNGIEHAVCNQAAGGRKGLERRREVQRAREEALRLNTTVAVLAVEVAEDRRRTAIVAAERVDGLDHPVVEVVRLVDGTGGALAAVVEAVLARPVVAVVIDPHGSASWLREPLAQELELHRGRLDDRMVAVVEPSTVDLVVAHQEFRQHLAEHRLKVVAHPALDEAARAVQERRLGGAFAPDRRSGDVSPIVAAELALWGLVRVPVLPPFWCSDIG